MAAARSDLPLTSDHEAVCALQRRLLGSGNARGAEAFATTVTASGDGVRFPAPNATPLPAVASMAPRGHSALEPDAGAAPAPVASKRAGAWRIAACKNTVAQFHGPSWGRRSRQRCGR